MAAIVRKEVDYGDLVRVRATYKDADTNLVMDPDVPKFDYRKPSGEVVSLVYPTDPEIVRESEGVYHILVDMNQADSWPVKGWSTGDGQAAAYGEIIVGNDTTAAATVSNEPVPASRNFVLERTDDGLTAPAKTFSVGQTTTLAVDFAVDLPANGRVANADTPTIYAGTAGGVTFGTVGEKYTKSKFRITFVTAGEYQIDSPVTYDTGITATGRITVNVVE